MANKPGRLRTFMTTHLRTKIMALVLAGICWFFVRTDQIMEVDFTFPLVVDMAETPDMVLLQAPPQTVDVRLRGRGRSLLWFALTSSGEYVLKPDPRNESHGVSTKNLHLRRASDLAVQSIFPSYIQLEMDYISSISLPVLLNGLVEPAEDYLLTDGPVISPERVEVSGPASILDTLKVVQTARVELLRRRRDVAEAVRLRLPWPTLRLNPESISLKARIERISQRRFTQIPLEVIGLPDSLDIQPRSFAITVIGGERQLEMIDSGDVHARVDYNKLLPGARRMPCQVLLPSGYSWRDPEPALFDLVPRGAVDSLRLLPADSVAVDDSTAESAADRRWWKRP